ncbi:phage portal protein [Photobacterium galatheae]|uniref:Portal protein n=1 Tax=Photobacterium galatheae TaxID=1654360 RepID=A0A066RR14_9GAMM|nr:phage portal protein [Photobacterium galatheae]KDM92890.1 portal protein [Photobacterium galatheae]MCM0148145.1 phage portal protein [Photobacterium galatheae]
MNLIDKALAPLFPSWAASRVKARAQIMAYEAATPSRLHKAKRESRSADNALGMAGQSLREQSRWLDENHDLVIGLLDKLEDRVIGADGIMVEPQPLNTDGTVNNELADALRRRWAAWSLRPEVTGVFARPELERLVLRTALRDGECFGQLVVGKAAGLVHPNPNGTAFSIEALEPDFVPYNLSEVSQGIRHGIRLNGWGQPIEYLKLYDHPGNATGIRFKTKAVPADRMLHLAFRRRLHQVRGVSILHGVITRLSDIKDYEEAERVAARIAAALGFYIKKGDGALFDSDSSTAQTPRKIDIAPGMIFDDLKPGEDLGMVESNRPNVHLSEFRNGQIRMVAAGTRSGYSSVARDYNGTFSSQRQELVESWDGVTVLQQWFIAHWARPVYRQWLQMELLNGLDIPDEVDRSTLFDAVYLGPVMPWIDPVKEVDAWKERVMGGGASHAQWIRAGGKNPHEVFRQIKAERDYFEKQGLKFDTTTGEPREKKATGADGAEGNGQRGDSTASDE